MKISVFGLGYVGSVMSACLPELGYEVIGVDVIKEKVDRINKGKAPIKEKDLDSLVSRAYKDGKLKATSDSVYAIKNSDLSFVCVGTPQDKDGSINLSYIEKVCFEIGETLKEKDDYHTIAIRSTIMPGTLDKIIGILEDYSGKKEGKDFSALANPEFMREGSAIRDFFNPPFIIIGANRKKDAKILSDLYKEINSPLHIVKPKVAEMIKYANNSFHALKVTFANEIGSICNRLNIDGKELMNLFCQDRQLNISPYYLLPGFSYGGSCLPKDLAAINSKSKELDLELPLLHSISRSNDEHTERALDLIRQNSNKEAGILGLSFKQGTDDIRGNPAISIIDKLIQERYNIKVYDPLVNSSTLHPIEKSYRKKIYDPILKINDLKKILPQIDSLIYPLENVLDSDTVVITNNNSEFRGYAKKLKNTQTLIDLQGIINPAEVKAKYKRLC